MKNIYVGNLPYDATDDELADAFRGFGDVRRATLVYDRETGRPRGFGFVEMDDDDEADAAIERMHGHEFMGRPLTVNEARRGREEREQPPAMHARPQSSFAGSDSRQVFMTPRRPLQNDESLRQALHEDTPEVTTSRGYSNSFYSREAG